MYSPAAKYHKRSGIKRLKTLVTANSPSLRRVPSVFAPVSPEGPARPAKCAVPVKLGGVVRGKHEAHWGNHKGIGLKRSFFLPR